MIHHLNKADGGLYIDLLLGLMIISAVLFSFLSIPEIFIQKQEIDYIARTIARRIEQEGKIDDGLYVFMNELKNETGLNPSITWSGDFCGPENKLQLREKFFLEISDVARIKIIDPSFSSPIVLELPIKKRISGVSEVYWKDLL